MSVGIAAAQPRVSFSEQVYPMLHKAGCQTCHFRDGVASATRLRFPDDDAPARTVEAFGRSLVEFVDRREPEKSLLWNKPTNRIAHTGGERIKRGSREESFWNSWIQTLAKLPDAEVRTGPRISEGGVRTEQSGGAKTTSCAAALTHQQYSNTIQDLLKETSDASSGFPPEDYVDGFKNQYRSQSLSPVQIEMYSQSAERLVKRAFLRGDSRRLLPCPIDQGNARCAEEFIRSFGRRAFRRPLDPREIALYRKIFQSESSFLAGVQAVMESMLQAPAFLFWMQESRAGMEALRHRLDGSPTSCGTRCRTMRCWTRPRTANWTHRKASKRIARQMLTSPKARTALDEFVSQWLRFDRALGAARERRTFPSSAANWCFRCSKNPDALSVTWSGTGRTSWTCSVRSMDSSTPTWQLYIRFPRLLAISIASISLPIRSAPGILGQANIPHPDQQTRRHRANVARLIHPRTISVPASASASAGRGYEPSAGQRV